MPEPRETKGSGKARNHANSIAPGQSKWLAQGQKGHDMTHHVFQRQCLCACKTLKTDAQFTLPKQGNLTGLPGFHRKPLVPLLCRASADLPLSEESGHQSEYSSSAQTLCPGSGLVWARTVGHAPLKCQDMSEFPGL